MNAIANYIEKNNMTRADFAALIGVTPGAVYQYVKMLRPVSGKMCVRIEKATGGGITRQALRPDDWADIWPELKEPTHA